MDRGAQWATVHRITESDTTKVAQHTHTHESESVSHSVVSDSLQSHRQEPARLLCPWNSLVKNTGVGCHSLLQGISPIRGSNPHLLHCRWILYCLSLHMILQQQHAGFVALQPWDHPGPGIKSMTPALTGRFFNCQGSPYPDITDKESEAVRS